MVTQQRFRNKYRIELRERDHGPPHVHLTGGGFDVLIRLDTLESTGTWPEVAKDEVLSWLKAHRTRLIDQWWQWHG